MNRFITAGIILAGILLVSAWSRTGKGSSAAAVQDSAYHKISAAEAKKMMDKDDVVVVDVRRADEYAQEHIPGALLIPNESIKDTEPEALPDKEAAILIHCRSGVRSKQAANKLVKMGYTNIYDFGGIIDWPYDTESGAAE